MSTAQKINNNPFELVNGVMSLHIAEGETTLSAEVTPIRTADGIIYFAETSVNGETKSAGYFRTVRIAKDAARAHLYKRLKG